MPDGRSLETSDVVELSLRVAMVLADRFVLVEDDVSVEQVADLKKRLAEAQAEATDLARMKAELAEV